MLQTISVATTKIVQSVVGQKRAGDAWSSWTRTASPHAIRIWIHAPSVGEGLVADPVLFRLAASCRRPMTAIRTYTSPSAARWPVSGFGYDHTGYLPFPGALERMIRDFNPSVIVYPRGDLWPALVSRAADAHIPQIVIGGILRADSRRFRWPGRRMTARMLARITAIGAVSDIDCERWRQAGASGSIVECTGDPRDDQVLERLTDLRPITSLANWVGDDFVLLAGSTHRGDEEQILRVAGDVDGRIVVVPHDPSRTTIDRLVAHSRRHGLNHTVLTAFDDVPDQDARLLFVSATGHLQDLYVLASVALVGGGFDGSRVHSLAEPAAIGAPILVGPGASADPLARRFLENGGARIVKAPDDVATACREWATEGVRRDAGLKARSTLQSGAASRTCELIMRVVGRDGSPTDRPAEPFR